MPLWTRRSSRLTIPCLWGLLVWACGVAWGETPLSLGDALGDALRGLDIAPREPVSTDLMALLPPPRSLYLDCDRLAFADTTAIDSVRGRPQLVLLTPLAARQLEVMERFFDALLADQRFAAESEAMAVAYVQFDRARVRAELGQYSELSVLELETRYQGYLHRRAASEIGQQETRGLLAESLGDCDRLPRDLVEPTLPPIPEVPPAFDELRPRVAGASGAAALTPGRGDADRALIAREREQQLFRLLRRLRLLDAAKRRNRIESSWNDLRLDRSRTLYEQEATADLGYSMSQQTLSRFEEQRIRYCRFLAWAEIRALTGEPVWTATTEGP